MLPYIIVAVSAAVLGAGVAILALRHSAAARFTAAVAQERARLATDNLEALKRQRAALEAAVSSDRESLARDRTELGENEQRVERREAKATAREQAIAVREEALAAREASIDRKLESLDQRDSRLRAREETAERRDRELASRSQALDGRHGELDARLQEIAGLTRDQARAEVMATLDASLVAEQSERIARHEKEVSARAKELGIEIVGRAIQRYAAEHTAETTTAKIKLPDEEFKGRIIGKEGRNIKAFEQATGVDIIIEDGVPVITVSCFDPVRREIAKRTLEELLEDGRIHPARIEEVLIKVQQEMDRELFKLGEDAAFTVEVSGLHPQLVKLLGKLHFRTSYGQNVLKHTQEVSYLCGAMAADMGLDPKLGRRCGLLHDIGKAIDHEQEGSHPELGYEALKRYGESEVVANAALAHHEGHEVISVYTVLAAAADAISAARPGARSENSERYVKRLQQLEDIACSFRGVQKAYAIQAGRELRVIISGHTLGDHELPKVARDIARRIEDEVQFPGEVKVTLIRETRMIAVAR
ncbi:MAG: ribonuclease Y [Planctomycetes bacterium]|nr:ribonuclease Y [Planctomycetota bacterium]